MSPSCSGSDEGADSVSVCTDVGDLGSESETVGNLGGGPPAAFDLAPSAALDRGGCGGGGG